MASVRLAPPAYGVVTTILQTLRPKDVHCYNLARSRFVRYTLRQFPDHEYFQKQKHRPFGTERDGKVGRQTDEQTERETQQSQRQRKAQRARMVEAFLLIVSSSRDSYSDFYSFALTNCVTGKYLMLD